MNDGPAAYVQRPASMGRAIFALILIPLWFPVVLVYCMVIAAINGVMEFGCSWWEHVRETCRDWYAKTWIGVVHEGKRP